MNTKKVGKWNVKIVRKGETYGRGNALANHDDQPLVEFYDGSQDPTKFGELGQFVTRYRLGTLLKEHDGSDRPFGRLDLHSDIPAWTVQANEMKEITEWLSTLSK